MKNLSKYIVLCGFILVLATPVFADGFVFEPRTTSGYSYVETPQSVSVPSQSTVSTFSKKTSGMPDIQPTLADLDKAQVGIRSRLQYEQTQYAELNQKYLEADKNYQLAKEERKNLKKLIKESKKSIKENEKHIKNINKIKEDMKQEML